MTLGHAGGRGGAHGCTTERYISNESLNLYTAAIPSTDERTCAGLCRAGCQVRPAGNRQPPFTPFHASGPHFVFFAVRNTDRTCKVQSERARSEVRLIRIRTVPPGVVDRFLVMWNHSGFDTRCVPMQGSLSEVQPQIQPKGVVGWGGQRLGLLKVVAEQLLCPPCCVRPTASL